MAFLISMKKELSTTTHQEDLIPERVSPRRRYDHHPSSLPTPRLPWEVWDLVIDALGSQINIYVNTAHATMNHCTLVCKAWHPRAQFWLLQRINLDLPSSLQGFLDKYGNPFLHHLHTIRVNCGLMYDDDIDKLYPEHNPLSTFATPLARRLHFPALRELSISTKYMDSLMPGNATRLRTFPVRPYSLRLCTIFASLSSLDIGRMAFASFRDLAYFLRCFVKLKTLTMEYTRMSKIGSVPGWARKKSSISVSKFLPNLERFIVRPSIL